MLSIVNLTWQGYPQQLLLFSFSSSTWSERKTKHSAFKGKARQRKECVSYKVDITYIKGRLAVDRGFPSLFAQTQANLFKNISFEASDDDFQETPLLRKGKDNIY